MFWPVTLLVHASFRRGTSSRAQRHCPSLFVPLPRGEREIAIVCRRPRVGTRREQSVPTLGYNIEPPTGFSELRLDLQDAFTFGKVETGGHRVLHAAPSTAVIRPSCNRLVRVHVCVHRLS